MGLLDTLSADPSTPQGMEMQGLFGGISALGAALAQATRRRPVGSPGPGVAEALLAFGQGQQKGLLGAQQKAQYERQMKRRGLLDNAQSDKPDAELSPQELAIRTTFNSVPDTLRPLLATMEPEQVAGLVFDREKGRLRPMTPEEMAKAGLRQGTSAMTSDWTGSVNVLQAPDTMSPAAMKQKFALAAASRQPQTTWKMISGPDGQPIAQVSSLGEYRPLRTPSEGFTLGQDQIRFGPSGTEIARGPSAPQRPVTMSPGQELVDPVTRERIAAVPERQAPYTLSPGQVRVGPDNQVVATGPEDTKAPAAAASELRGEWTKMTSGFRTVQDAYNKINMAGETGQGDMALLYGYMKLLDPESVVRESEFAMAAKTGSLPEQIQGWAMRVANGERLPDSVRNGFKTEAKNVFTAVKAGYTHQEQLYRDLAIRRGVKPEDVVLPFKFEGPTAAAPGGAGGAGGATDYLGILKK